ncbi:MAG: hypothetical protein GY744_08140 [Gammaproteobacteria bacterium]|nr:hypothetical protein [Gammaproteobacteria bacterium]
MMTENITDAEISDAEKRLKRNNIIVAGILSAIALTGILVPLFYYTGLVVPQ